MPTTKQEIEAIMQRDGCSRRTAFKRLKSQPPADTADDVVMDAAIETVLQIQENQAARLMETDALFENAKAREGANRLLQILALAVPKAA